MRQHQSTIYANIADTSWATMQLSREYKKPSMLLLVIHSRRKGRSEQFLRNSNGCCRSNPVPVFFAHSWASICRHSHKQGNKGLGFLLCVLELQVEVQHMQFAIPLGRFSVRFLATCKASQLSLDKGSG